jgi:hypothetical protein
MIIVREREAKTSDYGTMAGRNWACEAVDVQKPCAKERNEGRRVGFEALLAL